MIKIRNGVYETNSSSTHSIAIPNELKTIPNKVSLRLGEFGWENGTPDPLSYLYTAILCCSEKETALKNLDKLIDVLHKNNIEVSYMQEPKWGHSGYYDSDFLQNGDIDHSSELKDFLEAVLNNEDLLLRYIAGGEVATSNDNEDEEDRIDYESEFFYNWDTGKYDIPNPNYLGENYTYFYKGN